MERFLFSLTLKIDEIIITICVTNQNQTSNCTRDQFVLPKGLHNATEIIHYTKKAI